MNFKGLFNTILPTYFFFQKIFLFKEIEESFFSLEEQFSASRDKNRLLFE